MKFADSIGDRIKEVYIRIGEFAFESRYLRRKRKHKKFETNQYYVTIHNKASAERLPVVST